MDTILMAGKDGVVTTVKKSFQLEYKYNACQAGIEETIIQQTLNSSVVRDISRNLKINKNTVVSVLKKNAKNEPLLSHKSGVPNI